MVSILGLSACVIGALIVVLMLISLVYPSLTLSALVAKNMIYYTGHTLANLQIYVAAGIAYSVLPVVHEAALAVEPSPGRRLARHPGDRDAGLLPPPVPGLRAA